MGSEYPPVIIDSSGLFGDDGSQAQSLGSVMIRCGDFGTADSNGAFTIESSLVTLYLIRDNQLIHHGDYLSEKIELIYGIKPERTMAVGGTMSFGGDSDPDSVADSFDRNVIAHRERKVHSIRVPGRSELLRHGRDYHNFVLILRRSVE